MPRALELLKCWKDKVLKMGRVLFVACTNVGQAMIDTIYSNSDIQSQVVGIVNINAERGLGKANYHSYMDTAAKYDIPLHFCNNVNDEITLKWIKDKKPDIIIQTGWSQKFKSELLNLPKYGCIGEHPAPLPIGRGAACVNWAILTGETSWGDTFFKMVDEYDRGEVYAQEFFEIKEYDNVKTVYDKVALCSQKIIEKNIDLWSEGRFETIVLDENKATYYKRRTPADGIFDFGKTAKEIHDFIRAQTYPYPGAFFMYGEEKITVLSSKNTKVKYDTNAPGDIVGTTENGGVLVVCGDRVAVELLQYRRADGAIIWFAEDKRFASLKSF